MSHTGGMNGRKAWSLLAGAAIAIAAALLLLPTGRSQSCTTSDGGRVLCSEASTSLLSTQGGGVIPVLLIPAVLCLVPVLLPTRLTPAVAAAVLLLFCLMAALSVGLFYLPVAVAAVVLAVRAEARRAGVRLPKEAAS